MGLWLGGAARCADQPFRPRGRVVLKGETEAIEGFEPLDPARRATPTGAEHLHTDALLTRDSAEAHRALAEFGRRAPRDLRVALGLERIAAGKGGTEIVVDEK